MKKTVFISLMFVFLLVILSACNDTTTEENNKREFEVIPLETQEEGVTPEPEPVVEKSEEQIEKEILEYGKKEVPDRYKYVDYIDVYGDSVNIVLNTDSTNLTDNYGNGHGDVLAIIFDKVVMYSCGEDNYFDMNWYACTYHPRNIHTFNKSGKHIDYWGHDSDRPFDEYPPDYVAPKKYP